MRRFESRDVMVPVATTEHGELTWVAEAKKERCTQGATCGSCTNTTKKPKPKGELKRELDAVRRQLEDARA